MNKTLRFLALDTVQDFISENIGIDVQKLILNPPKVFKSEIKHLADQILSRQKAKGKIDSWLNHEGLIFPPPLSIEQASSDETAKYKQRIFKGEHLIDLTGGTGIDCLSLSKNFATTTYVERDLNLCEVFEHNAKILQTRIQVINQDAQAFLASFPSIDASFFIDPARRDAEKNKVFRISDCSPDLLQLLPILKQKGRQALIKLSPLLDIQSILKEVAHVKEIHVVSVKNDCKELLLLVDFQHREEPLIKAINLDTHEEYFDFKLSEEKVSEADSGTLKRYLYEPNASILKAGAFKLVGKRFELGKIAQHTHLYTSAELMKNWPGRTFEVIEQKVDKKKLKKYAPEGLINVLTRNYPISSQRLKQKFKVRDGGGYFLIGFRDLESKGQLVIAKRLN